MKKLGNQDCAIVFRGAKGKTRRELHIPKNDPVPVSVNELLACVILLEGKSKDAIKARALIQKELSAAAASPK